MAAGLRVLQTRDPQGLTFSDVTDSLEDLREQKRKEAEARGKQRLKDIEAVNNDLKTPYFRNQISKLTKEYQDYVQSPEYDRIKASQMKEVILNAKRNLAELDAYVAKSFPKDAGIYQERFNELFNGTIDYEPTPESLGEIKGFADYANIEPKDIIEVYNTDLKGVADGLLKAKETELGKSFNVSGKNFREVIQRLDPEDIDELARVAASRPELQKYYESELGRQITAQELKDLAYNDLFKFTPLERKTRESGFKEDDGGDGSSRFMDIDLDLSPTEVKVPYSQAKDSGISSVNSIKFANIDRISKVDYQVSVLPDPNKPESESNQRYETQGNLVRLDVGTKGENIGKPVGIVRVGRRQEGVIISQEVEVPYDEIKGEVVNGINTKYSKKEDRDGAIGLLNDWERKVESEALANDYKEEDYVKVYNKLYDIAISDKSSAEKTKLFKQYFPQGTDVKYIGGTTDISVNGKEFKLFTGGIMRPTKMSDISDEKLQVLYESGASMTNKESTNYVTPEGEEIDGWDDLSDSEKQELIDGGFVVEKK